MTLQDLASYSVEWTTPPTTAYTPGGSTSGNPTYQVYELGPPSQAWATLEELNILQVCVPKLGYNLATLGPTSPEYWHFLIEAKKLAYSDLFEYNGDPDFVTVPVAQLTSPAYAATLCSKINPNVVHQLVHEQCEKDKDNLPPIRKMRLNKIMDDMWKHMPWDEMLQAMVPRIRNTSPSDIIDALVRSGSPTASS